MIDIHAHILFGIDDGSLNLEDSLKILESAHKNGVEKIILTPHYILDSTYVCPNSKKREILKALKKNTEVELYLGNEIYMNDQIHELISKDEIHALASSLYILVELPVYNEYPELEVELFRLRTLGYKIIIAHPERYAYFKNDFSKITKLAEQGILFQGNYMCLYNTYGKSTKKLFKNILKHRLYSFMASDIHVSNHDYYKYLCSAKRKIASMVGYDYMQELFFDNALKIIKNEEVVSNYRPKKSIFKRRGNK